jgi:hypothetical protein
MVRRLLVLAAVAVVAAAAALASPASAAKPAGGSFTTTLTVAPTTVAVDGYRVTVSGSLTATVTQFKVDSNGHLVAVATVSGTLTATEPTLGTASITITKVGVVLNAQVQADCSGHLQIDFHGVLQIDATVVFTATDGTVTSLDVHKTVPLQGSLRYTAITQQQKSLICDIATLLQNPSSVNALVDKLNTLLKTV